MATEEQVQPAPTRVSIIARIVPAFSYALPALGAAVSALLLLSVLNAMRNAEAAGIGAVAGGISEAKRRYSRDPLPRDLHRRRRRGNWSGAIVYDDDHGVAIRVVLPDCGSAGNGADVRALARAIAFVGRDPSAFNRRRSLRGRWSNNSLLDCRDCPGRCEHPDSAGKLVRTTPRDTARKKEVGSAYRAAGYRDGDYCDDCRLSPADGVAVQRLPRLLIVQVV